MRTRGALIQHGDADDILDHGVGEHVVGEGLDLGEQCVIHRSVDGQLEALADANTGELALAETGEGAGDGLALRVEKFSLGHDLNDDCGHWTLPRVCAGG